MTRCVRTRTRKIIQENLSSWRGQNSTMWCNFCKIWGKNWPKLKFSEKIKLMKEILKIIAFVMKIQENLNSEENLEELEFITTILKMFFFMTNIIKNSRVFRDQNENFGKVRSCWKLRKKIKLIKNWKEYSILWWNSKENLSSKSGKIEAWTQERSRSWWKFRMKIQLNSSSNRKLRKTRCCDENFEKFEVKTVNNPSSKRKLSPWRKFRKCWCSYDHLRKFELKFRKTWVRSKNWAKLNSW